MVSFIRRKKQDDWSCFVIPVFVNNCFFSRKVLITFVAKITFQVGKIKNKIMYKNIYKKRAHWEAC